MPTISACLIVKDEEKNIARCLASLDPIVEEIILVDTGSQDKTIELATDFSKCRIFKKQWADHFSDARNESLKYATSEWILIIDADEVISFRDYEKIIRACEETSGDGFYMPTRNYTHNFTRVDFVPSDASPEAEGWPGWTPSHKTRIFRNNKGYRFEGRIHEVVDRNIIEAGGRLESLDVPVHHYGENTFKMEKIDLYRRLALKKAEEEPGNPMAFYELGQVQVATGEIDEGIKSFERGLELSPNFGDFRYGNLNYEIGNAYYQMKNDIEKALNYYLKAIDVRPGYMYVYSMVGAIYRKQGKVNLAEAYLKEAIAMQTAIPNTHFDLGFVYFHQKKYKEALKCFQNVIEMAPRYAGAYNNLAITYHLIGEKEKAHETWLKGHEIDPDNKDISGNLERFNEQWHAAAGNEKIEVQVKV